MSDKQGDWFHHAFKDDYLFLYSHRTVREAEQHIRLLLRYVPFYRGQRVLDLACGAGRHALAFTRRGAIVTAVDLSPVLLKAARERFEKAGLKATFKRMDMRELSYDSRFHGASMWFTSFGYFEEPGDDLLVLKNIERALKPGGWWWIDIINPEHLREHLVPKTKRIIKDSERRATVVEERKLTKSHVTKTIEISDHTGERSYVERVRLYSPTKFRRIAKEAGLSPQGVLGSYDGDPLSPENSRQIWYGIKEK